MIDKLTIEHLAPYLIHKLIVQTPKGNMQLTDISSLSTRKAWFNTREAYIGSKIPSINAEVVSKHNCSGFGFFLGEIKQPYLRPLSYLTKEITHNGEAFVPIQVLAGIACGSINQPFEFKYSSGAYGIKFIDRDGEECAFTFGPQLKSFYLYTCFDKIFHHVGHQYELFQKLYEWHFDIHGLLKKGLALAKH